MDENTNPIVEKENLLKLKKKKDWFWTCNPSIYAQKHLCASVGRQ